LLKQTTEGLARWAGKSERQIIGDLTGLAKVQVDFAVNQLEAALPSGIQTSVNSVEVSKSYAQSVVSKKTTDLNASLLSDDLEAKVKGVPEKFSLTAKKGSQVTLPNGEVLTKAFRGLAAKQADLFGRNIRDGLLSGETTKQISQRLYGLLKFEGGDKMKNNQVTNLVRTTVQSVSNQAAQTVYEANQDITKKYRWIATLDSRTAPECQILDQTEHKYGEGPEPPQHFGCRCRTTAVLDYKGMGLTPPKYKYAKRSGEGGSVPIGTSYGKWLSQQSASYKAKALGPAKVKYFNTLTKRYGPDAALKKLVRGDGTSKTIKQLQKTYGKTPNAIPKPRVKKKIVTKPTPPVVIKEQIGAKDSWHRFSNSPFDDLDGPSSKTIWTPERQKLHDEIVTKHLQGGIAKEKPTFFLTGGGPAAGKGGIVKKFGAQKGRIDVDSDEIKKLLPEYNEMIKKGGSAADQAAAFVHEESSFLSKRILAEAERHRFDTLLDGTGDGSIESLTKKVMQFKASGYRTKAKYVTVDIDTALQRNLSRFEKTGRRVPGQFVINTHQDVSRVVPEALKKGLFDEWELYDSNTPGKLIKIAELDSGKKLKIINKGRYDSFLLKAKPYETPIQLDFDAEKVYKKVTAYKVYDKNYLGGGEFGSAFKIGGKPSGIVKEGRIGEYEVIALQKLDKTGVAPRYFGSSYSGKLGQDDTVDFVKSRKGIIGMSKAKGKTLDDIMDSQVFDDFSFDMQAKKKTEMLESYISARKKMHMKGIAHNDAHEGNFMYDFKSKKGTLIDFGLAQDNPKAALKEALGMVTGNDSSGSDIMYDLLSTNDYGKGYTKGMIARYEKNAKRVAEKLDTMGFDVVEDWGSWMSNQDIDLYMETNLTPDGETLRLTDADALKFLAEIYNGV
jgi:SPP1 gp7 family putative phage head morphogenesis protein